MSYKKFKALLDLAEQQGIQLVTVADFIKFANENDSKKRVKTQSRTNLVFAPVVANTRKVA